MSKPIGALFETEEAISAALAALDELGLTEADREVVGEMLDTAPGHYGESYAFGGADEMAAELEDAGLSAVEADFYAQGVARGRFALLVLNASADLAAKAADILSSEGGQMPEDVV